MRLSLMGMSVAALVGIGQVETARAGPGRLRPDLAVSVSHYSKVQVWQPVARNVGTWNTVYVTRNSRRAKLLAFELWLRGYPVRSVRRRVVRYQPLPSLTNVFPPALGPRLPFGGFSTREPAGDFFFKRPNPLVPSKKARTVQPPIQGKTRSKLEW
jgi:hypothetical protein